MEHDGHTVKLEFLSPSGSFKDRGAAVLVSCLREMGVTEVVLDSSGNAGSAMAAYLAAAGITTTVFVPARTSPVKLRQIRSYGAELELVDGDRDDVAQRAQEWAGAHQVRYASHLWSPFFVAGMRTFAFELVAADRLPDAIVFPVGSGSLLLGAYEGFDALLAAGRIDRIPRLFGVQVEACAPLADAFAAGRDAIPPAEATTRATSIAEGILIPRPPRHRQILAAVRRSGGALLAVDDDEVAVARSRLARRGVYVEPTSAAAQAGWCRLVAEGVVRRRRDVLVVLTGTGLKAP